MRRVITNNPQREDARFPRFVRLVCTGSFCIDNDALETLASEMEFCGFNLSKTRRRPALRGIIDTTEITVIERALDSIKARFGYNMEVN